MEVFNYLRKIRLQNDLTQGELAIKSGVSRQTINAIERQRIARPNDNTMLAIAQALNCSVEEIFLTPLVKHVCRNQSIYSKRS